MSEDFMSKAKRLVREVREGAGEHSGTDIYVVWFSKTLQNWKALLSTELPDGLYYEVTYNGDKKEAYVDTYWKTNNVAIKDDETAKRAIEITAKAVYVPTEDENQTFEQALANDKESIEEDPGNLVEAITFFPLTLEVREVQVPADFENNGG